MQYVYHRKSPDMVGGLLYPLYEIEKQLPEAYEKAKSKYVGREHVMDQRIPVLNCRWNDVIHLSPISPRILFSELTKAGVITDEHQWYKIPISKLIPDKTVILKNEKKEITQDEILPFDPNTFQEMKGVNDACLQWYREHAAKGERPLIFAKLPHVLAMHAIDISDCEIFNWTC
ncbi:hypothetical protein D3C72_1044140 [compost metagenome]